MKLQFKKVICVFLSMALFLPAITMSLNTRKVQAETTLQENITYSESMCHETKTYNFTMPSSGYFWYEITPVYYTKDGVQGTSTTWFIRHTIYANYKQYDDNSAYYSNGTWRSFRYNFKKGTNVQIRLHESSDASYVWYYKIIVRTQNVKNFEKENNGARTKANALKVNKEYTGNMLKDDTDWWVFKAAKSGTYKITGIVSQIDQEATESKSSYGAYLNPACYVGNKDKGTTRIDDVSGYKTIFKGKLKKGQKVYVRVSYDNWYYVFYRLKAKKIK